MAGYKIANELPARDAMGRDFKPGDSTLRGTPAGVGMGRGRFLKPGETLRLWIENIGELRHTLGG